MTLTDAERSDMTETAITVAGKVRGEAIPAGMAFRGFPIGIQHDQHRPHRSKRRRATAVDRLI